MRTFFATFVFFCICLPLSAQAGLSCKSTSETVVAGNACGQLGETRMLSDGSGLVGCFIADTSQTGTEKDCTWINMSSSSSAQSGDMCGHLQVTFPFTLRILSARGENYEGDTYCNVSSSGTTRDNIDCHGNAIISDLIVKAGVRNYYGSYVQPTTPTGYAVVGAISASGGVQNYYLFVKPNCPSGYSLDSWNTNPTSPTASLGDGSAWAAAIAKCYPANFELTCVKD